MNKISDNVESYKAYTHIRTTYDVRKPRTILTVPDTDLFSPCQQVEFTVNNYSIITGCKAALATRYTRISLSLLPTEYHDDGRFDQSTVTRR